MNKEERIKEIAKLKAERVFIEAEIRRLSDIVWRNVELFKQKAHAEARQKCFNELVKWQEELENNYHKVWDLEQEFFK